MIQLASPTVCVIFRISIMKLRAQSHGAEFIFPILLREVLENPAIAKIIVGPHDIVKLKNDFDVSCESAIDLCRIATAIRCYPTNLRALTAMFLKFRMNSSSTTSNWEKDTLSKTEILYAATDAWSTLMVYSKLIEIQSTMYS